MNKLKWLVGLSAIFIAGCAAYFSVTGIALLFSGATLGVGIMAASLEIGKLVTASYLHQRWNKISFLMKSYLTFAVVILIIVTSMGIFGFLSNAYQKTALSVANVDSQVRVLEEQRSSLKNDISRWEDRIDVLTNQRTNQEVRYDSLIAGENWVNARRAFGLIESADEEIKTLNSQILETRVSVQSLESQILDIQTQNIDLAREIGGFKFIAEAFNVEIDVAVKWFIIVLISVFDPLAVCLVVAFNSLFERKVKEYDVYTEKGTPEQPKPIADVEEKPSVEPTPTEEPKAEKKLDIQKLAEDYKQKVLGRVSNTPQKKPNEKKLQDTNNTISYKIG